MSTNLLVIHNWGVSKANPWCKIYVYQIKTITATTTTTTIIITTATTTIKVNVLSCHTLSCAVMCRPIPIFKIPTIKIPTDTEIIPTGTINAETCDLWDIWSIILRRQDFYPMYLAEKALSFPVPPLPSSENTIKEQFKRLVTFETLITILIIENLDSWQSLWPDN